MFQKKDIIYSETLGVCQVENIVQLSVSKEKEEAGTIVEDVGMTVTVRYCQKAATIGSTTHRVIFKGEIYDITNVDHMNFKKKCLKFSCRKVRR